MADPTGGGWNIEQFGSHHDRSSFDCGHFTLSEWLRQRASQFERRDFARTYVGVRKGQAIVLGYYAISTHHVAYEALPPDQAKGLPRLDLLP